MAQPTAQSRDEFANKVITTAAKGNIDDVVALAPSDFVERRPEAQQLIDFTKNWHSGAGQVGNPADHGVNLDIFSLPSGLSTPAWAVPSRCLERYFTQASGIPVSV